MPFLYSSIVSQNGKINTQNRVKAIHCNRVVNCLCWNHRHFTQRLTQQDQTPSQCPMFILAPTPPTPSVNNVYLDHIKQGSSKQLQTKGSIRKWLNTAPWLHMQECIGHSNNKWNHSNFFGQINTVQTTCAH